VSILRNLLFFSSARPHHNYSLAKLQHYSMASSQSGRKRRPSSGTGPSHGRTMSRATQSSARSGSRYTTTSRQSSAGSSQGPGRKRAPVQFALTPSQRAPSAATTRTYTGSTHSRTTTVPPPLDLDTDFDHLDEVIMAVQLTERRTVGCAYYVARAETLYFMEDVKLGGPDIVDQCGF
jgi:DNA mismatch repair protein MSH5